jgi:ribonuclease PH
MGKGLLKDFPLRKLVAAVSAGIYQHEAILDLNYPEDRDASVDFNVVMTENGEFVELQGSGEEDVFTSEQMTAMLDLSRDGITKLVELQKKAIIAADKPSSGDLDGLAASFQH